MQRLLDLDLNCCRQEVTASVRKKNQFFLKFLGSFINYLGLISKKPSLSEFLVRFEKIGIISSNQSALKNKNLDQVYFGIIMEDLEGCDLKQTFQLKASQMHSSSLALDFQKVWDKHGGNDEKFKNIKDRLKRILTKEDNMDTKKHNVHTAAKHFLNMNPFKFLRVSEDLNTFQETLSGSGVFLVDLRIHKFFLDSEERLKYSVPCNILFDNNDSNSLLSLINPRVSTKDTLLERLVLGVLASLESEDQKEPEFNLRVFEWDEQDMEKLIYVLDFSKINLDFFDDEVKRVIWLRLQKHLVVIKNVILRFEMMFGLRPQEVKDRKGFEDLNQDLIIFGSFLEFLFKEVPFYKGLKDFQEIWETIQMNVDFKSQILYLKSDEIGIIKEVQD